MPARGRNASFFFFLHGRNRGLAREPDLRFKQMMDPHRNISEAQGFKWRDYGRVKGQSVREQLQRRHPKLRTKSTTSGAAPPTMTARFLGSGERFGH